MQFVSTKIIVNLENMIKILVGSKNPVKIATVKSVASQIFDEVIVDGVEVSSGVADQPMTSIEGYKGAKNRALGALKTKDSEYGVGIESFVEKIDEKMYVGGWIIVIDKQGVIGSGQQSLYELPEWVAKEISEGKSLGEVMGKYSEDEKIGQKGGTVELVSSGLVLRSDLMFQPLAFSFGRFVNEKFYETARVN